jgi:hypothetical protein
MGQQLMAHMKVVDELTVFREHATGELRNLIDSELQMATAHLQLARQTMQQLSESGGTPRAARRPAGEGAERSPERRPDSE